MSERDLHSAVVKWLANLTGLKVIKANQSGDRPPLPYVMVMQTSFDFIRQHVSDTIFEDVGADVKATPLIEGEWIYSLHAYGEDPVNVMRRFKSATHLSQLNEPLLYTQIAHDTSAIRYVPELVGEQYEPRAQMDLMLRGLVKDGFNVDVIEQYSFDFERV